MPKSPILICLAHQAVLEDEQVLELDVAVHDALLVHVRQADAYLHKNAKYALLVERLVLAQVHF